MTQPALPTWTTRPDADRVAAGGSARPDARRPAAAEHWPALFAPGFGDNDWVPEVWSRGRRLVILCVILFGTLAPARHLPLREQAVLYALSAAVLLGWAMPAWLPEAARREEVGLVLYGVAGTALAVL